MIFASKLVAAFIASVLYGSLFNVPRRAILGGGLAGAAGWAVFNAIIMNGGGPIPGVLAGAALVSVIAEGLATWQKLPATTIIVPGIIPLVPGLPAYQTMLAFVRGETLVGITRGTQTMLTSGAIAAGVAFVSLAIRYLRGSKRAGRQ